MINKRAGSIVQEKDDYRSCQNWIGKKWRDARDIPEVELNILGDCKDFDDEEEGEY